MKCCFAICVFLLSSLHIFAQNLLLNPSFEEYSDCPYFDWGSTNEIEDCIYWTTPTNSTDFFHACATDDWSSVPINALGYQPAHSGEGYVGIFVYLRPDFDPNPGTSYKEYLSTSIKTDLEKDSFYIVKMYVNLSNRKDDYACDCIEVWFTDYVVSFPGVLGLIEGYPQLSTPSGHFLTDTMNWMELCWIYKAEGGENYMTIGSFKNNYNVDTVGVSSFDTATFDPSIYYYIDDVSVEKLPYHLASINLGSDKVVCQAGISDTLTAHGFYTSYLWSTGDTTQSIVATAPGLYWVEASKGLCTMRDTIEIIYIEPDSLTLGPDLEICPQELPLQLSGPDYMDSYIWNTGGVGQNINITSEGEYTLQSTYACGEFEDTVVISFIPAEAIDLGNDTVLCNQPMFSRILEAPPGYDSYVWNNGSNGENIVVSTPGTYWLEATYACGTVSDTINIANQPLLSLHLGEDTTFCPGASITLSGGEGFETYAWSNGKTTSSIQVSNYGEYFVEANYACGTLRDTILIFEHIAPQAELPGDTAIHLGDNILINPLIIGDQITTYTWTPATWLECPDCLNTVASPLASVTYLFEIKDKYGCRGSDELTVLVKNHKRVFVPNAFSPNGDGTNDLFSVYGGPEVKKVISMKIFDRWGGMVYLNEGLPPDGSQGWDGNSNGKKLDQGIYIYLIQVDYINGESETISGDLMLHR